MKNYVVVDKINKTYMNSDKPFSGLVVRNLTSKNAYGRIRDMLEAKGCHIVTFEFRGMDARKEFHIVTSGRYKKVDKV